MIREYLLGQLTAEEQQQIEERLIADKDFFEQVMIEETELIDDYLAGSLVERESFINHFLSTPQQRRKVRMAAALREYIPESTPKEAAGSAKHVQTSNSWFRRLLAGIQIHDGPRKVEAE